MNTSPQFVIYVTSTNLGKPGTAIIPVGNSNSGGADDGDVPLTPWTYAALALLLFVGITTQRLCE
jgi:hypothetical protein